MSSRFDLIAEQFLQKPFADCTVPELQQLTETYPYSAPAHFLLAKKLRGEKSPEARALVQKAVLYYHQPAAFDAFLNSDFEGDFYERAEAPDEMEVDSETALADPEAMQPLLTVPPIALPQKEAEPQPPTFAEAQPALVEQAVEVPAAPAPALPESNAATGPQAVDQSALPSRPETPPTGVAPAEAGREPEALPTFEPYHTIDYFASQGIKLSQEEAGKDKMGKQLKSFTEWLKTMKRLPATEQLKVLDPHAEQKVESLAAHSVAETEIVTEAMAEVWLKQGNLEKAAAVYHKLSLALPSKRAYFAAKLESLKKQV